MRNRSIITPDQIDGMIASAKRDRRLLRIALRSSLSEWRDATLLELARRFERTAQVLREEAEGEAKK